LGKQEEVVKYIKWIYNSIHFGTFEKISFCNYIPLL